MGEKQYLQYIRDKFGEAYKRAALPHIRRNILKGRIRVYIPDDYVYTNDAAGKYNPLKVINDLNKHYENRL